MIYKNLYSRIEVKEVLKEYILKGGEIIKKYKPINNNYNIFKKDLTIKKLNNIIIDIVKNIDTKTQLNYFIKNNAIYIIDYSNGYNYALDSNIINNFMDGKNEINVIIKEIKIKVNNKNIKFKSLKNKFNSSDLNKF